MLCHKESQMWYYTESIFIFLKVQTPARLKNLSLLLQHLSALPQVHTHQPPDQEMVEG